MNIKTSVNASKYDIGVVIARFQVDELHEGQRLFLDLVCNNHSKVILFLGVPRASNTRKNPLDFATRKLMVQTDYPDMVILPLQDQRSDLKWSKSLDDMIKIPFGEKSALLYGSRDSFIPYYKGKYDIAEIETHINLSGSEVRLAIAKKIRNSNDFRAGIIHGVYARRDIIYPTVDIVAYNDKGEILLARKPNEELFRFVGGFFDREKDKTYEQAAKREFMEETGCEIDNLQYVMSHMVDDWRYSNESDGILTTLFIGKYIFGHPKADDDIEELIWVKPEILKGKIEEKIMPEHREMMKTLLEKINNGLLK